ncbi:hypothetical protein E4U56_002148 [Claviceps arundinis]|uniref:Uncharacterized protein n=1 Tax=Claviceps arundinis TaxID=1623583 RepID=A0A9P7SPG8_9HYPO|nr:hypothetical protein E4U56_002148 [Claviceps arundinis]
MDGEELKMLAPSSICVMIAFVSPDLRDSVASLAAPCGRSASATRAQEQQQLTPQRRDSYYRGVYRGLQSTSEWPDGCAHSFVQQLPSRKVATRAGAAVSSGGTSVAMVISAAHDHR